MKVPETKARQERRERRIKRRMAGSMKIRILQDLFENGPNHAAGCETVGLFASRAAMVDSGLPVLDDALKIQEVPI